MQNDFCKIILKFLEPKPGGGILQFWDPTKEPTRCGGNFNMQTGKLITEPFDQKRADDHCKKSYDDDRFRCKMNTEWTESSGVEKPDCSPATICGRCHLDGNFWVSFVLFSKSLR